jgi:integrase/recombinase XerC
MIERLGTHIGPRDLIAESLQQKRSKNTRAAYEKDLRYFFSAVCGHPPTPEVVKEFLNLDARDAVALVSSYRATLIDRDLKEATVNRRLAAIKDLVRYATKVGKCEWNLASITGEKVKSYRDTTGIEPEAFKQMMLLCDRATVKGKRDYALLRLLWENALRRGEVSALNIGDFDVDSRRLWILGKGRGSQKEAIAISTPLIQALSDWLAVRCELTPFQPLFVSIAHLTYGHRLSGTSIYRIVRELAAMAGIKKTISPHRIRHSGITAALVVTGGDVRRVQKLSRHSNLNTLMIYDDNRLNHQSEISEILSELI